MTGIYLVWAGNETPREIQKKRLYKQVTVASLGTYPEQQARQSTSHNGRRKGGRTETSVSLPVNQE